MQHCHERLYPERLQPQRRVERKEAQTCSLSICCNGEFEESRGALQHEASHVLMKVLSGARLARPDLVKAISDLTSRRLTVLSRAHDKRLPRMMLYLSGSIGFTLPGRIGNQQEELHLCAFTRMRTTVQPRGRTVSQWHAVSA